MQQIGPDAAQQAGHGNDQAQLAQRPAGAAAQRIVVMLDAGGPDCRHTALLIGHGHVDLQAGLPRRHGQGQTVADEKGRVVEQEEYFFSCAHAALRPR